MSSPVEDFLIAIDKGWTQPCSTRITLRVIGSTSLLLQTDYVRGTKDSDVLETIDMAKEVKQTLLTLAGEASLLAIRHRMYLDIVAGAIPFLPNVPIWHPMEDLSSKLTHFQIEALDIVDTVVSKLKRFNANDQSDIKAMIERELVDHERLLERFVSAVDRFSGDARAEDLPRYVRNLHRVERDIFFVDESEIDLPGWI